ncbi:hypothetical protein HJC23_003352 [Cyclotella cryptica]|uniref:Macro domain-containing protein n=1 Tax=Cyclotella cryptica TaxID=29204 RepID=A0ABD3QYP1_9STRA|eukprot:CCRYP_000924-RA/>CCRYP_000924-RA protein AED:0.35 eAED:0.35 QI:0/-1/0/1/-1/1/1/0/237
MKQPQNLLYWLRTIQSTTAQIRTQSAMHSSLPKIATYRLPSKSFHLTIARGSITDYSYPPNPSQCAIVNAANEACLGGGGVDGAVSFAGGMPLQKDRMDLPQRRPGVRCRTGEAVMTGPNDYGSLNVRYVIHAVGPNYLTCECREDDERGDELLAAAYTCSLKCAECAKLEAVAFSLLSAGVFRGNRSLEEVLTIGMRSICDFHGYEELREVVLCGFSEREVQTLLEVASLLGLEAL